MATKLTDIEAILFDLDETLIDAYAGLNAAHLAVVEKLLEYFPSFLSNWTTEKLREKLQELDDKMNIQTRYDRDKWWPKFLREFGIDRELGSPQIGELTQTYWNTYIRVAKPYDSAKPLLERLKEKDLDLGIVTDTDRSGVPKKRRISGLEFSDLFDVIIVGGEDTERTKPDPEPFELAASRLDLNPSQCAFVGDKPFTDIKGAKSAGMKTILVRRREWGEDNGPDFIVDSLEELRDLF